MKKYVLNFMFLFVILNICSKAIAHNTIVNIKSDFSVSQTADRFVKILKNKGLTVFSRIDHAKNAESVSQSLSPTEVVIFGNPKVGTPLMNCSKTVAIDLPQKALFWQDKNNDVWLSYNNPDFLKKRHKIKGCDAIIEKIKKALAGLAKVATKK